MKYNMDNLVCMPKSNSTRVHVLKFQIKTFHPGGTRGLAGLAAALHRVRPPLSLSSELGGIRDSRAARIARSRKEKKHSGKQVGRERRRRMQQQMAATVEEQMMVKAIREESPWEALPKRIQAAVVSKEEWHRRYVSASDQTPRINLSILNDPAC